MTKRQEEQSKRILEIFKNRYAKMDRDMTQENIVPTIEERLETQTNKTAMSIGDLARLANMSESHLAAILNNKAKNPSRASMLRLRNVMRKYNLTIKPHKWNKFDIDAVPDLIDSLCRPPQGKVSVKPRFQPITITHIAHMIGYTRDYISSVLRGKRPLTLQLQAKLNHLYDAMPTLTQEEIELREILLNKKISLNSNDADLPIELPTEIKEDLETSAVETLQQAITEYNKTLDETKRVMADMKAVIDLQAEQLELNADKDQGEF